MSVGQIHIADPKSYDPSVQAMVAAGLGFALSPLLAVDVNDPKVRLVQLEGLGDRYPSQPP